MAEVLEYTLVVLASSALTFFSIGVYSGLVSSLGPVSDQATFATVVTLANAAVEHGSASAALQFRAAMIGCDSGTLTFATPRYSQNSSLPVNCSIHPVDITGDRRISFEFTGGLLTMKVS